MAMTRRPIALQSSPWERMGSWRPKGLRTNPAAATCCRDVAKLIP